MVVFVRLYTISYHISCRVVSSCPVEKVNPVGTRMGWHDIPGALMGGVRGFRLFFLLVLLLYFTTLHFLLFRENIKCIIFKEVFPRCFPLYSI